MNFAEGTTVQNYVLQQALNLAGYDEVSDSVLAAIDTDPNTPTESKAAIRAMAYKMATYNGGNPDSATVLHIISTAPWESIGITTAPALDTAQREAIIGVIMAVSKQVILAEANRLELLAANDTALPAGWNDTATA